MRLWCALATGVGFAATGASGAGRAPPLDEAFAVAFAQPEQRIVWQGGVHAVRFSPFALYPLEGGVVALVAKGADQSAPHAANGYYSVTYLERAGRGWRAGARVLGQGSDGGYGRPPGITLDRTLSRAPTLRIATTHQVAGEGDATLTLVRLGRTPQVVADGIPTKFTGEYGERRPFGCAIYGRLEPGRADRMFTVAYRGDFRRRVVWTWDGARWRSAEPALDLWARCPVVRTSQPQRS